MTRAFIAPREMLERKPAHGSACNSCGLCCYATLCSLAQSIFGDRPGPCPALRFDADKKSSCDIAANPLLYSDKTLKYGTAAMTSAALLIVRSGQGCDARFNGEPSDKAFDARLDALDLRTADQIKAAKQKWGMR